MLHLVVLLFLMMVNIEEHTKSFSIFMHQLEICGTGELVGGVAATGLGPNVNTQCRFPL